MPVPGVPNNPSGVNGFNDFAQEPPYGEVKKQKALAGGSPMAGGQIAAGAIRAPQRSQDQAVRGRPAAAASPAGPPPAPAPLPPSPVGRPMTTAEWFAALAAEPGAEQYPILAWLRDTARG